MQLVYSHNTAVVVEAAEDLADRAEQLGAVLEDVGERMVEFSIPENFARGGRPDPWPGSSWSRASLMGQTRRLLNSITAEVAGTTLVVGTNVEYAAQRHFGGVLKPTRAKALAIPLPGVPLSMDRPRKWGDRLVFAPTQSGDADSRGILGEADDDTFIPRFALRAQIEQPARPFLLFQADDLAYAEQAMVEHMVGASA